MPKSRRIKKVALTKTKKRPTSDLKQAAVQKIHKAFPKFTNVFAFTHEHMTTLPFREIQQDWKDAKFFLGKNKLMKHAIGKAEDDSFKPNSYRLGEYLTGHCGLLFTNKTKDQVVEFFENYSTPQYADAGTVADRTLIMRKGFEDLKSFSHSMEPYLRKLGLNTSLINAAIHLNEDFIVAEEGKQLSVEQTKILRLLKVPIAQFRINIKAWWNKNGSFKAF
jgi:mRNA turnover protein 4